MVSKKAIIVIAMIVVAAMMTTTATNPPMMAPVLSLGFDEGEAVTSGPTGTGNNTCIIHGIIMT